MVTATGFHNWAAASGPPCPELPQTPVPVTVNRCPPVTACPNSVPVARREHAHPAVGGVGDVEVARRVERHAGRLVQLAGRRGQAVPVEPGRARAGHRHRRPGPGPDLLDALRGGLGDVHVTVCVDGHGGGVGEGAPAHAGAPGERGGASGPQVQPVEGSGVGRHDDDPAVVRVGDEEVAGRIERDPARSLQHAGGDHRVHGGRGAARRGAHARSHAGERDEPGQGHGQSAHAHIMPVAAAAGTGGGP